MNELPLNQDELICALATGWNVSALGVIRTSGSGAIDAVASVFSRPGSLKEAPGHTVVYGHIVDPDSNERVDQVLASVFRSPRSYTGEDSVEITCHGGIPGLRAVIDALHKAGFRDAGPGEFTMRGFINGKLDLTRAEAVQEIVTARTAKAHEMALHRLSGSVERRINLIKEDLIKIMSALELQLDYPEDEVGDEILPSPEDAGKAAEALKSLADTFREGRLYQEGVKIVLTGATNAGKSSLFNLFLREERAIVSDIHGTTRDYLESGISIEGIPVTLYDTAGIRQADNPVELEGIRRSGDVTAAADLVIYMIDGRIGATEEEMDALGKRTRRDLFIWNKTDLAEEKAPEGTFGLSTVTGEGFDLLEKEILTRVRDDLPGYSGVQGAVIDSKRQFDLLTRGREAMERARDGLEEGAPLDAVAVDLREALDSLGEITGEVTSADILDSMFSSFCVGK